MIPEPSMLFPPTQGTDLRQVSSTVAERAALIDTLPWGARFPWHEVQILAGLMRRAVVAPKGVIFRESTAGDYMALVQAGEINVLRADSTGKPQLMATVRPGQTLGEMTLVDEWTRSGTAIAVTEVHLIVLTRAGYDHLCEQHPAIALRLMTQFARIISQRLRRASKALVEP